jgi:hypothetical protein
MSNAEVEVEIGPDREKCQQEEGQLEEDAPAARGALLAHGGEHEALEGVAFPVAEAGGLSVRVLVVVPDVFAHKCLVGYFGVGLPKCSVRLPIDPVIGFAHGDRPQLAAAARPARAERRFRAGRWRHASNTSGKACPTRRIRP